MTTDGMPAAAAAAQPERRRVGDDAAERRASRSMRASCAGPFVERSVERRGAPDGLGGVEPEAVDLDDAGVAFAGHAA